MLPGTPRPRWLTFDCYGTLIQWDEGLRATAERILERKGATIDAGRLISTYDEHEYRLEQTPPYRTFRSIAAEALGCALRDLGTEPDEADATTLTEAICHFPPFPEAVETLAAFKRAGFNLGIVSNTDDDLIEGNAAQLGGYIDRIVTAQQAGAYKPDPRLFEHAWATLGTSRDEVVHICAGPRLDLTVARDLGFRAVWIDRGTGRKPIEGYMPDAALPTLDRALPLFRDFGWISDD